MFVLTDNNPNIGQTSIVKVQGDRLIYQEDYVAVEKPVEIWLNGSKIAVLYASPQYLTELAVGFLVAKKHIDAKTLSKVGVFVLGLAPQETYVVRVTAQAVACSRGFIKDDYSLPQLQLEGLDNYLADFGLAASDLCPLMRDFVDKSQIFKATGGVHSSAIAFGKEHLFFCEDVARYNAYNKAIGYYVTHPNADNNRYLLISGRVSGEMIEECLEAGINLIISKSAPLERAVTLAKEYKVGLIGFVRGESFNIYNL